MMNGKTLSKNIEKKKMRKEIDLGHGLFKYVDEENSDAYKKEQWKKQVEEWYGLK